MLNPVKVWCEWKEKKQRYEVGFYWEGKRYRFYSWRTSLGQITFKSKEVAEEFASQIKSDMRPKGKDRIITFNPEKYTGNKKTIYDISEHAKVWLKNYEIQIKTEDISEEYHKHLERYFRLHINPVVGDIDIRELNEPTIQRFYQSLFEKDLGKKHVCNIMDCLKKFMNDAYQDKIISEIPRFPKYKNQKHRDQKKKVIVWLTEEEQDLVLSFIPAIHKAMAACWLYHGLRAKEVRDLKRKDYNPIRKTISVDTAKGGQPRELLLEPLVIELINKIPPSLECKHLFHYPDQRTGKRRCYKKSKQWGIMRNALDKAGLNNVRPYDSTRHSHASQLLRRGASTRQAQTILGHSDIRVTENYLHTVTEDQRKFQRVVKCNGGQLVANS